VKPNHPCLYNNIYVIISREPPCADVSLRLEQEPQSGPGFLMIVRSFRRTRPLVAV
jgi:hypothetical protein